MASMLMSPTLTSMVVTAARLFFASAMLGPLTKLPPDGPRRDRIRFCAASRFKASRIVGRETLNSTARSSSDGSR